MALMLVALVAGVVAITVVQVAVYYYLLGGRATANGHDGGHGGPDHSPGGRPVAPDDAETERVRRCAECGAPNGAEGIYTFCRHCGAKLS